MQVIPSAVFNFKFNTVDSTGAPIVLTGTPTVTCYKDNSLTQSAAGLTLTTNFDGVVGLNNVQVDTSADGAFYSSGSVFQVVISAGTAGGVSQVGRCVGPLFDILAVSLSQIVVNAQFINRLAPLGYGQVTSLSAAAHLPSVGSPSQVPPAADTAFIVAQTQNVRWRDDGVAPTATIGQLLVAGTPLVYTGDLATIQFIEVTASAALNVGYYKNVG
jgi:hypothetical protein